MEREQMLYTMWAKNFARVTRRLLTGIVWNGKQEPMKTAQRGIVGIAAMLPIITLIGYTLSSHG